MKRPKGIHRLGNARDIEKLPEGLHPDGGSLYLQVRGGGRSWVFRTRNNLMGLGSIFTVTPEEAREEARKCRLMQMQGVDPLEAKRAKLAEAKAAAGPAKTFREVAEEWLEEKAKFWKPGVRGRPGTLDVAKPRFAKHIYPVIGDEPIQRFDMRPKRSGAVSLVDSVIAPLWAANKITMAKTLQEYIKGVLDLAIARNYGGLANGTNAASVKKDSPLAILRPKVSEVYTATSQPAFPWQDIGRLVAAIREYTFERTNQWPSKNKTCQVCTHPERAAIEQAYDSGVGRYRIGTRFGVSAGAVLNHAQMRHTELQRQGVPVTPKAIRPIAAYVIEFIILTAVRKSQACMARWDEIDMGVRVWKCEDHKTRERKVNRYGETVLTGEAHVIPLSDAAMAVLHAMKERQKAEGVNSEYVFPSHDSHGHADHALVNKWLRGSAFKKHHPEFANIEFTPHGMRTAFKSWAMSQGFPEVDSELALAHAVSTPVSRIYAREADTIERRRVMMQQWADHCGRVAPVPAVVVPFRQAN